MTGKLQGSAAKLIFEVLARVEAANASQVTALAQTLRSLAAPERYVGLWAWSAWLEPGDGLAAAIAEVRRWVAGDEAALRDAALVITWRASAELLVLVPDLAARFDVKETETVQRWAMQGLYALALAKLPISPAFPAFLRRAAAEQAGSPPYAGTRALDQAAKNGERFELVADDVTLALPASADLYGLLLDGGFVPPASHRGALQALLYRSATPLAVRALSLWVAAGDTLEDMAHRVDTELADKTAHQVTKGLYAAAALTRAGLPFSRFAAGIERALHHKTTAARAAAHRMLEPLVSSMAAELRLQERASASSAGLEALAAYLNRDWTPKAKAPRVQEPPPPALELVQLSKELRSDAAIEVQRALYQVRRADLAQLSELLPALIDALGGEGKPAALDQLTRGLELGLDLKPILPLFAGLWLDRDFHDLSTLAALLRFAGAALKHDYDLAEAWLWIPNYMAGKGETQLRFDVARQGIAKQLGGQTWFEWLTLWLVDITPERFLPSVAESIRCVALSAACLASFPNAERAS